jgi:hypothetical protein
MRLLQSVLTSLHHTKKPQDTCVTHLVGLRRMLPGHAPLRNMRRDSPSPERTLSRWYGRGFDGGALPQAALTDVVPPEQEQAVVLEARCVPNSGQHPSGLARCWNGSHRRAAQGRAIAPLGGRDLTAHGAYGRRVEQTPPSAETAAPEATRMDVSLDHLRRVGTAHDGRVLRDVGPDGASRTPPGGAGVRALERHQHGTWRAEAPGRARS